MVRDRQGSAADGLREIPQPGHRSRRSQRRYSRRVPIRRRVCLSRQSGCSRALLPMPAEAGALRVLRALGRRRWRRPSGRPGAQGQSVGGPGHAAASAHRNWTVVAKVRGSPAAWIAQRSGVTFMRLDQSLVHLTLHAGSTDGGVTGWTYGDQITPREIHFVVAAFNGGFKLTYPDVGFVSGGHVAVALKPGLASIVTYTDGTSNIGAWNNGVPRRARRSSRSCRTSCCSSTAEWRPPPSAPACPRAGATRSRASPRSRAPASGSPRPGSWCGPPASSYHRPRSRPRWSAPELCGRSSSTSIRTGSQATSTCTMRAVRLPCRSFPVSTASRASCSHHTAATSSPWSRTDARSVGVWADVRRLPAVIRAGHGSGSSS